ncbi:glycosyltransferase family 61 protein [Cohnella caldifontis]|uniref:glycosyltransferase family 61 protein n=1 Tax=Cohnella caldifontis TaxID=3027471 RepID=UPI0023EDF0A5|nr:glycosyltransferase family 61 protein [Cohnella sp. YIM B05605]
MPVDPAGQPVGLWERTKDYLASVHGAACPQYYKEHHKDDVTELYDSKGIDPEVHEHFRGGVRHGRTAFTAVLHGARVWELNGAAIAADGKLLADVSWDYRHGIGRVLGWDHNVFHEWIPYPLTRVEGTAALLTHVWSGNYFHWMFDVLPRIDLLRSSGVPIDRYIIQRNEQQIQEDTLNLLGIPKEQRIEIGHDFHAQVDTLVVPSFVKSDIEHPSEYPRWAADFLRYEFLYTRDVQPSPEFERIYVSRANAWQRRLLNEEQIQGMLWERGFRTVRLEELPFEEQVRIFASAKVVAAPHGAGLTNLVFCTPGTKVIEMLPPNYVSNYFWHLSNQVCLDHYYLIGDTFAKPQEDWWNGSADFAVDPEKFKRLLERAGV